MDQQDLASGESGGKKAMKNKKAGKRKVFSKKRKYKSHVWGHFKEFTEDGISKARCNHCGTEICCDGNKNGTSSMGRHLTRCKQNPANLEDQKTLFMKKNDDGEGGSYDVLKTWKFDPAKVGKALLKMIVVDELPFAFVDRDGFREYMEAICPAFTVPTRWTIAREVIQYCLEEKDKLKVYFMKSKQRVCLTTDTWTSIQRISYMVLTAHFVDESWIYHKRIINFRPISGHTGDAIARAIEECLEEWGIENVMTISVDNATANDVAIEELKGRLPNLFRNGRYLHVRCVAHIINLVVKDGLKKHDKTVERIRNAVRYIRQSPARLANFKACVKDKNIESKAMLSLDVPTRWNSTFEMLERAIKFEKAFELYDRRHTRFRKDLVEIPDRMDWVYATKMADLLGFYKKKTLNVSGSLHVIAHQFFSEVMDIESNLDKFSNEDEESTDFGMMTKAMKTKFEKYFKEEERKNLLFDFAIILDPRMKLQIIQFSCERACLKKWEVEKNEVEKTKWSDENFKKLVDGMVNDIKEEMEALFKEYRDLYENGSHNPSSNENIEQFQFGDNSFLDAFQQYRGGGVRSLVNKTELEKYLQDEVEGNNPGFDILNWWKTNSSRYPTLAKMAKDILAIPVSTVASESAFSTGGRVLDVYRSSLAPPVVEALICTQDWVRKGRKDINEFDDLEKLEDIAKDIYENVGSITIDDE